MVPFVQIRSNWQGSAPPWPPGSSCALTGLSGDLGGVLVQHRSTVLAIPGIILNSLGFRIAGQNSRRNRKALQSCQEHSDWVWYYLTDVYRTTLSVGNFAATPS